MILIVVLDYYRLSYDFLYMCYDYDTLCYDINYYNIM